MGGRGSGRRWQSGVKGSVDGYLSVDVRWLKRRGFLVPDAHTHLTWSRQGEVFASITIRAEPGREVLSYRHRGVGSDWTDESYPVEMVTTPCHMGGQRHWFLCPVHGCGRRVAMLYGGAIFACRNCHQLSYPSQREDVLDRTARRANRIRERMGWPGGIRAGSEWNKPKGMHWRTYERLRKEHDMPKYAVLSGFVARFGPMLGQGGV